jgi:chromate transport protein ChrA
MRSSLGALALINALLWVLVNVGWLSVGSEQLTGSQLNNLLNLLPAIALLMIFISAYKRFQRTLWIGSGVTSALVAVIVITSDFAKSPAVIEILEGLTGIQNATPADAGLILTAGPMVWVSFLISLLTLVLALFLAARPPQQQVVEKEQKIEDNRSLWDEQE